MLLTPWITGVETIEWQTYHWLVGHRSVCGRRVSLRPIGCTPAVCIMNSATAAAVCDLWRYTSVICLCPLPLPVCMASGCIIYRVAQKSKPLTKYQ